MRILSLVALLCMVSVASAKKSAPPPAKKNKQELAERKMRKSASKLWKERRAARIAKLRLKHGL